MKSARTFVLMFACTLLLAVAYAGQSGSQSASASPKSSAKADSDYPRAEVHGGKSGHTNVQTHKLPGTKAQPPHNETRPGQNHSSADTNSPNSIGSASKERGLVSPGSPASPAQTGNNPSVYAANSATIPNATVSSVLRVRPPSVASPPATPSSNPRHLNPNPPVINGATGSKAHNSAAIDGTNMHRRP